MEMHGRELGSGHIHHVDVQGLRLVDVSSPIGRHVQDHPLADLPHGLIELLDVVGEIKCLDTPIVGDELEPQLLAPQVAGDQVTEKVPVDLHELPREHSAHVEVLRVRLEGLIVPQDLCCARRRHWRDQERVPETELGNLLLEALPVPTPALRSLLPHVKLEDALAHGTAFVGLIGAKPLCQLAGRLASGEVDSLEDVLIQSLGLLTFEG
mmetsp:Transcript_115149/g.161857  ORF Transcript_115149/g.161857 Transcript_115149/m.161857 type:complete len:210 (+) Transcript_115149:316-945(+)